MNGRRCRLFPARLRLTPLGHSGVNPKLTPSPKPVKVGIPPQATWGQPPPAVRRRKVRLFRVQQKLGRAALDWTAEGSCPPPPAVRRSEASLWGLASGEHRVELRSTGQLRTAVPTWFGVRTSGFAYAGCGGTSFRLFRISQNTVPSIPSQPRKLMTAAIFVSYCSTPRLEKMVCQSCST